MQHGSRKNGIRILRNINQEPDPGSRRDRIHKTKTMTPNKLHIEPPQDVQPDHAGWQKLEEMIMIILRHKYHLVDADFLCGTKLNDMYTDSELRDICLLAAGSDWTGQVLSIGELKLKGSGPCPNCGAIESIGHNGFMERDQKTGMLYIDSQNQECANCQASYVLQN